MGRSINYDASTFLRIGTEGTQTACLGVAVAHSLVCVLFVKDWEFRPSLPSPPPVKKPGLAEKLVSEGLVYGERMSGRLAHYKYAIVLKTKIKFQNRNDPS